MPQIIMLLLAGAGLYAGVKWFAKHGASLGENVKRAQEEIKRRAAGSKAGSSPAAPAEKNLGELERDPKTGEYRPKQES